MAKRIDRDNEPYRTILSIPKEKINELFSLINQMDTQILKQFSIINSVTLNVELETTGDNLIHKVILLDNSLKKEFHRLNMIKFLYQNGVNPDKPNRENQTPLHLACKNQYYSIVEYLISLNVDFNFRDNNGMTPFHYALLGKIELYIEPTEIKDFITKPKKIDFKKKDELINIKKDLWEKIKDTDLIKSINKTVDDSIYSDESNSKLVLDFTKKLADQVLKINKDDILLFIKQQIELTKKGIEKNVNDSWGKFNDISELVIHPKEETSLQIKDNDLSPLKNVNVKEQIKKRTREIKQSIKNECEKIKSEKYNVNKKFAEEYSKFYKDFYEANTTQFNIIKRSLGLPPPHDKLEQTILTLKSDLKYTNWDEFNKSKMHSLAIDFADNIISWDDMTFLGGSRQITINNDINNIKKILEYPNIEERVFHILAKLNDTMTVFNKDDLFTSKDSSGIVILTMNTADEILINLPFNLIFKKPITISSAPLDTYFLKYNKLFEQKDFASVLYTLGSIKACYGSSDNLTGNINSEYCALTLAIKLSNKKSDVINNELLECAFKKYYISYISSLTTSPREDRLFAMINILLAKNLVVDVDSYLTVLPEKQNIKDQINLFFTKKQDYDVNKTSESQISFNYESNNLIKLIVDEIEKMDIKPIESDIVQILTFILNKCDTLDEKYFDLNSEKTLKNFFPIVTFDKYDEEATNNYINKFIYLIKEKQNMNMFPFIYHLFELFKIAETAPTFPLYEEHSLKKLHEARHLGLYYQGLLPYGINITNVNLDYYDDKNKYPKNTIGITGDLTKTDFSMTADVLDATQIPMIGNYLEKHGSDLSDTEKFIYYGYSEGKFRPPLEVSIKLLKERNKNYLLTILSKITSSNSSELSLINLVNSNSKLAKIFIDIYPAMVLITELLELQDDTKTRSIIEQIIKKINEYNGYILLYYYLLNKENLYKIPKFNYYEIPNIGHKSRFLYYDSDDLSSTIETVIPEQTASVIYNQGLSSYKELIKNINNNIIRGNYIIKKEALVRSKSNGLPPSIKSILPDFYKYNLILLIESTLERADMTEIFNKIDKLKNEFDITKNNVITYITIGKLIQELVSDNAKNFIQQQSFSILSKLIKKYNKEYGSTTATGSIDSNLIIKSDDFELFLNSVNITSLSNPDDIEDENIYQFSKVYETFNENINFIIYPEEYANSEILNSKYKLTLNENIFKKLLESPINPYINDLNNQSAIFPVLKIHNYKIIKTLKNGYIDFREFSDINALDFLIDEYNNHLHLLTNNDTDFKKWLSNFVYYQKNEIKTLILSNDKFGNNVPNYLEDSFEVICYLTNQYLSESVHKIDNPDSILKDLLEFPKDTKFNEYLFINEHPPIMFNNSNNNFIQDLINNKQIEANKVRDKCLKLNKGTTKNSYKNKLDEINKEITEFQKLLKVDYIGTKPLNHNKILDRYASLNYDTGTTTKLLTNMIKSEKINGSLDLLTFKILEKESEIINKIKTNPNLEKLKIITNFYENTNNISEIYFTFGKYTNNNKVKAFVRELLIYMTQHFIIFPYIMILRKTLFAYFKSVSPNLEFNEINNRVSYCFDTKYNYEKEMISLEDLLYKSTVEKFINYSVSIFENTEKEAEYNSQNIKEILDLIIGLLSVSPILPIPEDSKFMTNMKEINSYFDVFVPKTILNWLVVIENVFKFNINEGRIVMSLNNLIS